MIKTNQNFDNTNSFKFQNTYNSKLKSNSFTIRNKVCNYKYNNKILIILCLLFLSSYFLIIDSNCYTDKYLEIDNITFFNDKFHDKENRLINDSNQDDNSASPKNLKNKFIQNKKINYSSKLNNFQIYKETQNICIDKKLVSNNIYEDKQHKIAYCIIPKNACTKFKGLFLSIAKNQIRTKAKNRYKVHSNNILIEHFLNNKTEYLNILHREDWIKFVVIRDPLERLLSGFLDKCVHAPYWCEGSKTRKFSEFINRLVQKSNRNILISSDHYYPQYSFCNLAKYFNYFEFKIFYDYQTIANQTKTFLQKINFIKYYYKWGKYYNLTMFEQRTKHATFNSNMSAKTEKINFYKKYYTKELALKALKLYEKDYELFNWKLPEWLIQLLFFVP